MKITVFSDLHVHQYRKYNQKGDRLALCLRVVEDIFKYNKKNKICYTLFCGDFYDTQKGNISRGH